MKKITSVLSSILIIITSLIFLTACSGGSSGGGNGSGAALVTIKVLPGSAVVGITSTVQFTAVGTYSDGSTSDITATVSWSSSDDATATVSNAGGSEGMATGIDLGTVTVSALDPGTGIRSGDTAESASLLVTSHSGGIVLPLYGTNGAGWNDYVKDDGADMFSATDTACDPSSDTSCIHGGQMRYVEVTGISDCTGLTASDILDMFKWECDASTDPVRMVSTGLKDGRHLSDLIDFFKEDWRENIIAVYADGSLYTMTPPAIWWDNAIVVNNDGSDGSDMSPGEIHIVTTNAAATYTIGADKVALVIGPGVTLTGSATTNEDIVSAASRNFLWLEGKVDGTGDNRGISFNNTVFSVLRGISADNANNSGVYLSGSSSNTLSNITATANSSFSVYLEYSSNNTLSNITASGNYYGIYLYFSSNNTLSDITASGNNTNGVFLYSSLHNTLSDITASANSTFGVYLESSSNNNTFTGVTAIANGGNGIYILSSSSNTLSDITASDNYGYGVYLSGSSKNSLSDIAASGNAGNGVLILASWDNSLTGVTATANDSAGVYLASSSSNTLSNIMASGNAGDGVSISFSSSNTLSNITASGNPGYGVYLISSSNSYFTGLLKVGGNASAQCYVSGGTDPGLVDGTCANQGSSDATYSTDTTTLDVLSVPTGDDTLTHLWSAADAAACGAVAGAAWGGNVCSLPGYGDQTACETAGGDWTSDKCYSVVLRNAVEVQGDAIENENTLCETGETCLYTPNIGADQGSGNLIPAGTFTEGTLTGITLMEYESNP